MEQLRAFVKPGRRGATDHQFVESVGTGLRLVRDVETIARPRRGSDFEARSIF
jgi:hypothetical protein